MRGVNSAFFTALQQDVVLITELITLQTQTRDWKWTTNNVPVVSSGSTHDPFPGGTGSGIEESTDLGIATVDFVLANSGGAFDELLDGGDLDMAAVSIRRVLTNSPDLGSMTIFSGKLGDYSYTRRQIMGQARNEFDGVDIKWPYYTYMDQCAWRFGSVGCAFDTTTIVVSGQLDLSGSDKLNALVGSASLTNSGYAAGHFDRGRITFLTGSNSGQIRTIRSQSGDQIDFSHAVPFDVTSGDFFKIFRGCRKRPIHDCLSVFNNSSNFLGFHWIPRQENAF